MAFDELYQEIILDHYRAPRNRVACDGCDACARQSNPLCGDEIAVGIDLEAGAVAHACFDGHGCSISQASASMMTEAIVGKSREQALALIEAMRQLMHGQEPGAADEEVLGDLVALSGVARFPVRVKCALLPWTTLKEALEFPGAKGEGQGQGKQRGGAE